MQNPNERTEQLVQAFRIHYHNLLRRVEDVLEAQSDTTVVARIGDDLDAFTALVHQV